MAYIGTVTQGAISSGFSVDQKVASRYQAPSSFTAVAMRVFGQVTFATGEKMRLGIYSDSSGSPDALLGYTEEITGAALTRVFQADLVSTVSIVSGSYYWLGAIADSSFYIWANSGGSSEYNADTYSDGFSDPYGSSTSGTHALCISAIDGSAVAPGRDLDLGGAVLETSGGTKYAKIASANYVEIYSSIDSDAVLETSVATTLIFGSASSIAGVDAALDSLDDIHVSAACTTEQTRDVAYRRFGGSLFHFNDATPADPSDDWQDDASAFDGDINTSAYADMFAGNTDYLTGDGTTAPSSSSNSIGTVRVRFSRMFGSSSRHMDAKVLDGAETLLSEDVPWTAAPAAWSDWYTLSTPTGGWTWAKLNGLTAKVKKDATSTVTLRVYAIQLHVSHAGEWSTDDWEEIASYTDTAPSNPGVAIDIDSDDCPRVLLVNATTSKGSTADEIAYTAKLDTTGWSSLETVSYRVVKTDAYDSPRISMGPDDEVNALFQFLTDEDACYRVRNGTWGTGSTYTSIDAEIGENIVTSTSTTYNYTTDLVIGASSIKEGTTDIGYDTSATYRRVSAALFGTTRYVFFVNTNSNVQVISNPGAGWLNEGQQQIGTYQNVITEWSYNNEHQANEINYIYDDGTEIFYDSFSLVAEPFPPVPGRVHKDHRNVLLRM